MEMTQAQLHERFETVVGSYARGTFRGVCRYRNDEETIIKWMMEECHNADLPEPVRRLLVAAHRAAIAHDAYELLPDHEGML